MAANTPKTRSESVPGLIYAGSAFFIWGLSPVYWKALDAVPALEITMHRVAWSFVMIWAALGIYSTDSVIYYRRKT